MSEALILSTFSTPIGWLQVEHDEHFILKAFFSDKPGTPAATDLAHLIQSELSAYFANPQHRFQLPLKPQGSLFQQKVWNALLVIPVGRTLSYGELALKLQTAPRAIGQACKRNPLVLFIPCHRVVGKNSLGGFMGSAAALAYKSFLLAHEHGI